MLNQALNNAELLNSANIHQKPAESMDFDNYSSHLSVFEKVFSTFSVRHALEFGPGKYSTKFMINRCESVVSVEQDSCEWYNNLKSQISSPNWNIIFHQNQDPRLIFNHFDIAGKKFDLVFSDGAYQTRCLVANLALEHNIPVVLLHDAEKIWYYKWNLLNIPANYERFDFRHSQGERKVTTVLANDKLDLIDKWVIPEHDRILHVYSSPRQPIFQILYSQLMGP